MKAPKKVYVVTERSVDGEKIVWCSTKMQDDGIEYIRNDLIDEKLKTAEDHAYFAGAVNEREKMMKEAVEAEVTTDNRGNNVVRAGVFNKDFEYGDKVRVIIVKEEK